MIHKRRLRRGASGPDPSGRMGKMAIFIPFPRVKDSRSSLTKSVVPSACLGA